MSSWGPYISKVSQLKGIRRFGEKGKLTSRYIKLFKISNKVGIIAYKLAVPLELSHIHGMFHVLILQKYMRDLAHALEYEPAHVKEELSYKEQPLKILDRNDQVLHSKAISLVKVLWSSHSEEDAIWERG